MAELSPEVLEILVCPSCHANLALDYDKSQLQCTDPDCGLAYPIRNGIPILLIDEAIPPTGGDHESL